MSKQVSIYLFKLPKKPLRATNVLSDQELARLKNMLSEKRKLEFATARVILREVLNQYHNISTIQILESKNGKPFSKKIKFNISHSRDHVVIAVSQRTELGVDIESPKVRKNFKEISETYFSKKENEFIFSQKQNPIKIFTLLWSLKESYFKAFDQALSADNAKIYFDLNKRKVEFLPSKKKTSFLFSEKWNLSVCAIGNLKKSDFKVFEIQRKKEKLVKKSISTSLFKTI